MPEIIPFAPYRDGYGFLIDYSGVLCVWVCPRCGESGLENNNVLARSATVKHRKQHHEGEEWKQQPWLCIYCDTKAHTRGLCVKHMGDARKLERPVDRDEVAA